MTKHFYVVLDDGEGARVYPAKSARAALLKFNTLVRDNVQARTWDIRWPDGSLHTFNDTYREFYKDEPVHTNRGYRYPKLRR